ncbi:MAG: CARDB domain-containing protein [Rivularia sp. (in: cyanobacteria)]|jgi:hypothetical protein
MKKIIAASFASALCFLSLASTQLPAFAEEAPTDETTTETLEAPASTDSTAIAKPDLIIRKIKEDGNKAKVLIRNIGTAPSTPSKLRVYQVVGAGFKPSGGAVVPAIPAGGSTVVQTGGAAPSPSLYFVDAANTVSELNEANNLSFVP